MKKDWENVTLMPEFDEQGVACYRLDGGDYLNEYYVVSEAETRKLLNTPEIVGYEVYNCLIPSTSQMLYYLKEQKKVTTANILSILRGALNYPLEESCYREHIRVHDISFLSSERVFQEEEIAGLEIKYSKLTMVPDSTLMIGDIIASGETLIHCLRYVTDFYRNHGAKLRNIIIFTIGGTKGIEILEDLTRDIREFWDRWHITLSHWFRDFIFTRFVMYSSKKKWFSTRLQRACAGFFVDMGIMGLWHGITPSYILYGLYHGLLLAATETYQKKSKFYKKHKNKTWYQVVSWAVTMQLVFFGFFLFSGKLMELVGF